MPVVLVCSSFLVVKGKEIENYAFSKEHKKCWVTPLMLWKYTME